MAPILRWIWRVSVAVLKWSMAHPAAAVAVGTGLGASSLWLKRQPWAGAPVVAALAGYTGTAFFVAGLGAWLGAWLGIRFVGTAARTAVGIGAAVPASISWWWWVQRAAHGGLPWP